MNLVLMILFTSGITNIQAYEKVIPKLPGFKNSKINSTNSYRGVSKEPNAAAVRINNVLVSQRNVTSEFYCRNGKAICHQYIKRMIKFYKTVGGWVLLSIVLFGMLSLFVTCLHGKYLEKHYTISTGKRHRWAFSKDLLYKVGGRTYYAVSRYGQNAVIDDGFINKYDQNNRTSF